MLTTLKAENYGLEQKETYNTKVHITTPTHTSENTIFIDGAGHVPKDALLDDIGFLPPNKYLFQLHLDGLPAYLIEAKPSDFSVSGRGSKLVDNEIILSFGELIKDDVKHDLESAIGPIKNIIDYASHRKPSLKLLSSSIPSFYYDKQGGSQEMFYVHEPFIGDNLENLRSFVIVDSPFGKNVPEAISSYSYLELASKLKDMKLTKEIIGKLFEKQYAAILGKNVCNVNDQYVIESKTLGKGYKDALSITQAFDKINSDIELF